MMKPVESTNPGGEDVPGAKLRRPGASPGSLIVDPSAPKPELHVVSYGPEQLEELEPPNVTELGRLLERAPVTWVNVDGLGDAAVLEELGRLFDLHPLALEDVVNVPQRAKVEDYDPYLFLVARMPSLAGGFDTEQVSLFVKEGLVITFQERSGDCFDPVRERLRKGGARLRRFGADYLAYALLDALIDSYFPVLEQVEDTLEETEQAILAEPDEGVLAILYRSRRHLIELRKAIWPHREAINRLLRSDFPQFSREVDIFLRDCYDHTVRIIDLVESYREFASGLMDFYLSQLGHRTNEAMKVLTIIATIFIPLSFIAGLYGMNFNTEFAWNMPELGWPFGYPLVLGVMASIALGLLWYFRRKGWF